MKFDKTTIETVIEWVGEHGLMEYGGASLQSFVNVLGIDVRSHYRWLDKYVGYAEAIAEGKRIFREGLESRLVRSLARSAEGFKYMEITTEYRPDKEGNDIEVRRLEKECMQAPSTSAATFLLSNLAPDKYALRGKQEVKVVSDDVMSLEEVEAEIARLTRADGNNNSIPCVDENNS